MMERILAKEAYEEIGILTTLIEAHHEDDGEELYTFLVPTNDSDFHIHRLGKMGYNILSDQSGVDFWSLSKEEREEVEFYSDEYNEQYN